MIPSFSPLAWLKLGLGTVAALALALLVHDRNRWKSLAADRQAQLVRTAAAFDRTVANYRSAAARAKADDAANAARVEAQQSHINSDTEKRYEARLADARAAAERLRAQLAAASDSGPGRDSPVSRISAPARRPAEAAGENGFPLGDRLIATEQAIQLDELIAWVRRQHDVEQDGGPGPVPTAPGERASQ